MIKNSLKKYPWLKRVGGASFDAGLYIFTPDEYLEYVLEDPNSHLEELLEDEDVVQALKEMNTIQRLRVKKRLEEKASEMSRYGAKMENALILGAIGAIEAGDYQFPLIARYEREIIEEIIK